MYSQLTNHVMGGVEVAPRERLASKHSKKSNVSSPSTRFELAASVFDNFVKKEITIAGNLVFVNKK